MKNLLKKYNLNLNLKNIDKKIIHLFEIFDDLSLFICTIASILLFIYNKFYISRYLFESSILIFRAGIIMCIFSFICTIFFSNYLKEH